MKKMFFLIMIFIITSVYSLAQNKEQVAIQMDSLWTSDGTETILSKYNKIIFINLKFIEDKVSLNNFWIVEGKLKGPKAVIAQDDQIYYSVFTEGNDVIFNGSIQNPLFRRYEYVDDEGQLQNKVATQDSADILIRAPFHEGVNRVEFSKVNEWSLFGWTIMKRKQNIGTVFINLNEITHEK